MEPSGGREGKELFAHARLIVFVSRSTVGFYEMFPMSLSATDEWPALVRRQDRLPALSPLRPFVRVAASRVD